MNLDQFGDALKRLSTTGLQRVALGTAKAVAYDAEAEAKENLSGRVLRSRTGRLVGTVQGTTEAGPDRVTAIARVGGGGVGEVPYAAIHEHGGTIYPKRGQFLAIPMGPALKSGKKGGAAMWPRDIPGLTFIPIKGGAQGMLVKRMAVGRSKTKTEFVPWFHLVRSVRMPRRPYLRPAAEKAAATIPTRIAEQLRARLEVLS